MIFHDHCIFTRVLLNILNISFCRLSLVPRMGAYASGVILLLGELQYSAIFFVFKVKELPWILFDGFLIDCRSGRCIHVIDPDANKKKGHSAYVSCIALDASDSWLVSI